VLHPGGLIDEVRKIKQAGDDTLLIFGSGSIIQQLAPAGLIDDYWLAITPVVLGQGKPLFAGVAGLNLTLVSAQAFASGNVLLHYHS
jgi:dihydrofolate reductase